jgi:hypothetical protein
VQEKAAWRPGGVDYDSIGLQKGPPERAGPPGSATRRGCSSSIARVGCLVFPLLHRLHRKGIDRQQQTGRPFLFPETLKLQFAFARFEIHLTEHDLPSRHDVRGSKPVLAVEEAGGWAERPAVHQELVTPQVRGAGEMAADPPTPRLLDRHGDRVMYLVNTTDRLQMLDDESLDFVYSSLTLQHIWLGPKVLHHALRDET